ncbi:MAG TPA: DPP IV N-terminal domain-containing protein, partial [Myxococcales bacterium]|nr:DPP IV N-terminal domain-containing protein [Myxococcales bacterium]
MLLHAAAVLWMAAAPPEPAADDLLRLYAETRHFRSGLPVSPKVARDGTAAFFLRSGPKSDVQSLFMTDVATGQTKEVLSPEQLLAGAREQLTAAERARLERQRISARGFTSFQLSRDGQKLVVTLGGRLYLVTRPAMKVTPLRTGETPIDPQFSPDGSAVAYVSGNDVFAVDLAQNRERRVTRGGTGAVSHGLAEFVAQEEMDRFSGFWWSPDGKWIAFQETDDRPLEPFTIVDPMHPEQRGATFPYPRAGRANAVVRLGVVSAGGAGKPLWVQWDAARYPYLATVRWSEGAPLTLLVENRAQNEEVLLRADPATGKTAPLLTERSSANHWLDLAQDFPLWKKDGSGFFWMAERGGGPAIELRDAGGAPVAEWVPASFHPEPPAGYDDAHQALYFAGAPEPARRQLYRATPGRAPEPLPIGDPQPAMVTAKALEPETGVLVATSSSLRSWTSVALYRAEDGKKLADLPS